MEGNQLYRRVSVRIRINWVCGSGSGLRIRIQEGIKKEKLINCKPEVLDVLFLGLEAFPVA
jgi:hypothetical protein